MIKNVLAKIKPINEFLPKDSTKDKLVGLWQTNTMTSNYIKIPVLQTKVKKFNFFEVKYLKEARKLVFNIYRPSVDSMIRFMTDRHLNTTHNIQNSLNSTQQKTQE